MTEISIGKKEKMINKGTDKQYVAVFVTQYNSSLSSKFQNPNPSSCLEILDGKKVYRQTNIVNEKAKTIYPLYALYRGYNKTFS